MKIEVMKSTNSLQEYWMLCSVRFKTRDQMDLSKIASISSSLYKYSLFDLLLGNC